MHLYVTSMLQKTDIKAVALQMALDMLHEKDEKDLVTGLNSRMNAGRPNWNKVFTKLQEEKKGKINKSKIDYIVYFNFHFNLSFLMANLIERQEY